jgi:hypothetical protein
LANQKQELPVAAMFGNGSNQINKYTDNQKRKKWKKFNLLSFLRHKNDF